MDLTEIRERINKIDKELINLVYERLKLSDELADFKHKNNLPIQDKSREDKLIEDRYEKLKALGIDDKKLIQEIFNPIMKKMRELQEQRIKEINKK